MVMDFTSANLKGNSRSWKQHSKDIKSFFHFTQSKVVIISLWPTGFRYKWYINLKHNLIWGTCPYKEIGLKNKYYNYPPVYYLVENYITKHGLLILS